MKRSLIPSYRTQGRCAFDALFCRFSVGGLLLFFGLTLLFPFQSVLADGDWSGRVVWVQDGDSLIILRGEEKVNVRVQGIDAPEKDQPFGKEATMAAIKLAKNQIVQVLVKERDKYGRLVARVILPDGRNLSYLMVRSGNAWRHVYFARDPLLITLEAEAKQARRGLWKEENPIPPWVWKHDKTRRLYSVKPQ